MDIADQLKEWNKAYRSGNPIVPDPVYDALLDQLPENHPYRHKIEPEELYKGRIKHLKPMLSMQKAKTEKEISKWIDKIYLNSEGIDHKNILIKCSAKLDGIAGKCEGLILSTRGDGIYGNDVSNAFEKGLVFNNEKDLIYQLGEFVVNLDYFNQNLCNDFSTPRNFVSGAIMSDTVNSITNKAFQDKAIAFQAYSCLPNKIISINTLIENFRDTESFISNSVNYDIDGVIFEVVNKEIREKMGETDHHPNYAIALKPQDKTYQSIIIDIKWQTGRTGKVTPVIIIEPVIIDGVEVRRASGHNAKMILTMGIEIGMTVELIRSGSVIPYIVKVIDNE